MTNPSPPGPDGPPEPPIQAYQPPPVQPYQPPPAYQAPPPYGYYPNPVARVTEPTATASMVVSFVALAGLCVYGLGGVLGIVGAVLGHHARRRIRETGAAGDGLALTGVIVSWITVGIAFLGLVAFIVGVANTR